MVRSFNKVTTLTVSLMAATIVCALVAKSYASSRLTTSGVKATTQQIQVSPAAAQSADATGSDTVPVIINGKRIDIAPGESQTLDDGNAVTTISNNGSGVTTTTTTNPPAPVKESGNGNVSISTTTNNSNSNSQSYTGFSSSNSSWSTSGSQSYLYSSGTGNVVITH